MNFNLPKIVYRDLTVENVKLQLANIQQITFEVTDACNLKCKYCTYGDFYEGFDNRQNIKLPIKNAISLLDFFAEFWNSERNLSDRSHIYISFYGGEPLLNMPFIETIVDYVENELHCPNRFFKFSITTNGVLLHKYFDFFAKHNFNLTVSLDGNAENNSYRVDHKGKPAFEKILQNIDLLKEKHPVYFRDFVNFNSVLHNKNSVESIYNFFKERYDKIPNIGVLNDNGIKPDMQQKFLETYRNKYESLYESTHCNEIEKDMFIRTESFRNLTVFIHRYSGFVFKDYKKLLYDKVEVATIPTGTCIPFSNRLLLTVNGKILPCERIGQHHVIGTVNDNGVNIDLEEVVSRYNRYYKKITKQCAVCSIKHACMQCLFNLNDLETTCRCTMFMNEKDFEQYTENQINFLKKNPESYYRIMEEVFVD